MATSGWWRFWSMDTWRSWRSARTGWTSYTETRDRLDAVIRRTEEEAERLENELRTAADSLRDVHHLRPQRVLIETIPGETGLATVHGVELLETTTRGRGAEWTVVDRGSLAFTDRRVVFIGHRIVVFSLEALTEVRSSAGDLLVRSSSHTRDHKLRARAVALEALFFGAKMVSAGSDPSGYYLDQIDQAEARAGEAAVSLRDLRARRAALRQPARPVSPVWVPAGTLSLLLAVGTVGGGLDTKLVVGNSSQRPDPTSVSVLGITETSGEARPQVEPAAASAVRTSASSAATTSIAPATTSTTVATTAAAAAVTVAPTTAVELATASAADRCHPSYTGACVPVGVKDVDCKGGSGNGPFYVGRVTVVGPDIYDLDRDDDGIGCEGS